MTWLLFSEDFTNIRQCPSGLSKQELMLVEECNKNGLQEFNLPNGYTVGGTPAKIDTHKYFFSQTVSACYPSKNDFHDEKGEKMISSDIFSINDKACCSLLEL